MSKRPGGELATRPLHFIWIADASGSMKDDGKIQSLNMAIREAIPHMQKVASENPNAQVLVRAIKFASGAQWHISQPTKVEDFKWEDLKAAGVTDMGKALSMVAEQLDVTKMGERALPPVLVLISDGQPTDSFEKGLKKLMDKPWGTKAVRIAIAIGQDADHDVLQKFIGHNEIEPLQANNPEALVNYIKWVSTAVLKSASAPASQATSAAAPAATPPPIPAAAGATPPPIPTSQPATPPPVPTAAPATPTTNVPIPSAPAPANAGTITADDVW